MMKKNVLALCLLVFSMMSSAKDIKVNVGHLPSGVTSFVYRYYPSAKIIKASQEADDKDYNIKLSNGTELEFSKDSQWIEVNTKSRIPAGILPQEILNYVDKRYPGKSVRFIEHCKYGYEIKLNNKKSFQLDNNFNTTKFKEDND